MRDINLEIKAGETIALAGVNGSGKSTLTYLLVEKTAILITHRPAGVALANGVVKMQNPLTGARKASGTIQHSSCNCS